jgi:aminobenzoyl-glutamate utilization protein A
MNGYELIAKVAEESREEMIARRRDYHKHAETGWLEMRTSSLIARELTNLGYEVLLGEDVCNPEDRMGVPDEKELEECYARAVAQGADPEFVERTRGGKTGVIGILRCGEGPTVAMRFDIDALGVFESDEADHKPAAEGFASVNYGSMHACGHDGHATIGLGVAKALVAVKDQLHGTVRLIFQPGEEGVRGAKGIVMKGHLDNVDYFLSGHVSKHQADDPGVFVANSYGALATCKYDAIYHGFAAHAGGSPNSGKNAMLAACTAVLNLQAIPRHAGGATRINVGRLIAGSGRNVICDEAKLELEVRGATAELNDYMCEHAERILKAAAAMHDCTVDIKLMGSAIPLKSDAELAERVRKVAEEKMGLVHDKRDTFKSSGSEDCSYMMKRVQEQGGQAIYMRLMTTMAAGGHNRRYDFGEKVLVDGVKIYAAAALDLMSE